jgi:hypothetical protein
MSKRTERLSPRSCHHAAQRFLHARKNGIDHNCFNVTTFAWASPRGAGHKWRTEPVGQIRPRFRAYAATIPLPRNFRRIFNRPGTAAARPRRQKARQSSRQTNTSVAGAILVNVPALEGWYLLLGQAVAISCTTGICALLFSCPSRREGARGEIGVARIEHSRTH